jgi:glycine/D-amino acid oxidase-like deaminating enzyme
VRSEDVDIAVIGAGIVGLACAHFLSRDRRHRRILLIDPLAPMSLTSAASGENYRNWWPHPVMTAFTDFSIDLLERISREGGNRIQMRRRGYVLATRMADPEELLRELHSGYGSQGAAKIRVHERGSSTYVPAVFPNWETAPDGVDVIRDRELSRRYFPNFDPEITSVLHIRRAGDINGQQLGSLMLEEFRARGGALHRARLVGVDCGSGFRLRLDTSEGPQSIRSEILVNAAGPYVGEIAGMLGETIPVSTVFQQKIAFEDTDAAIPRQMPFAIDLDAQTIDWSEAERAVLREDAATAWLAQTMPGGIHCRPDGGERGKWIKLGWAFNRTPSSPSTTPPLAEHFPEIVLRGASRLNPALKAYYGRLPRRMSHYGGYYTMTRENWPLIGPMRQRGAFIAGALSGFGTMAACATGALIANWVRGEAMPEFARALSLSRYDDHALIEELNATANKGVL